MRVERVLVREVPGSFGNALRRDPGGALDPVRARGEHAAYVRVLEAHGVEVTRLPADEAHPDCPFVEDTAVVLGGVALIARSARRERRGEAEAVARHLADRGVRRVRMQAPAVLDGGDVMVVGRRVYVGRSARTNQAGVEAVRATFGPQGWRIVPVPVPADTLHLKGVCSALDDRTVLLAEGTVPRRALPGVERFVTVPRADRWAANAVPLGEQVLVGAGHPAVEAALRRAGFEPVPVSLEAFRAADGSATCLALAWQRG